MLLVWVTTRVAELALALSPGLSESQVSFTTWKSIGATSCVRGVLDPEALLNTSGTDARMMCQPSTRTVSSRRRISGRAMEHVNGHESFLALNPSQSLMTPSILLGRLVW